MSLIPGKLYRLVTVDGRFSYALFEERTHNCLSRTVGTLLPGDVFMAVPSTILMDWKRLHPGSENVPAMENVWMVYTRTCCGLAWGFVLQKYCKEVSRESVTWETAQ